MTTQALPMKLETDPKQGRVAGGAQPGQQAESAEAFARMLEGGAGPGSGSGSTPGSGSGAGSDFNSEPAHALPAVPEAPGGGAGLPVALEPPAAHERPGWRHVQELFPEGFDLAALPPAIPPGQLSDPMTASITASITAAMQAPGQLGLADLGAGPQAAAADGRAGADGSNSLSRLLGILQLLYGPAPGAATAAPGEGMPTTSAATLMQALGGEQGADSAGSGRVPADAAAARAAEAGASILGTAGSGPGSTTAATAGAAGTPSLPVSPAADGPDWAEAMGQRVLWMVRGKIQTAELRLNPAELGTIDVRVRMEEDGLRLSFNTATAGAREALEQAAPRLRDALQSEGFSLAGFDIDQRDHGDGNEEDAATAFDGEDALLAEDGEDLRAAVPAANGRGLVDTFV